MFSLNSQVTLTLVQTMYPDPAALQAAALQAAGAFGARFGGATVTPQTGVFVLSDGVPVTEAGFKVASYHNDSEANTWAIAYARALNDSLPSAYRQESMLVTATGPDGACIATFVD